VKTKQKANMLFIWLYF